MLSVLKVQKAPRVLTVLVLRVPKGLRVRASTFSTCTVSTVGTVSTSTVSAFGALCTFCTDSVSVSVSPCS
jgi:hypothetical protein